MVSQRHLARSSSRVVKFATMSFPLTLILLSAYFRETGIPGSLLALLYALSIPAYYYVAITFVSLLLTPLAFIRWAEYLVAAPKVCMDFYLFVDLFIFNVYRFHIDGMFINILIHDFYGIGIPPYIIGLLAAAFVLIALMNVLAFIRAKSPSRWLARIPPAMVVLFTAGQLVHIWGIEYGQRQITRYTAAFPYYFPVKAGSFMRGLARNVPCIVPAHSNAKAPGIGPDEEHGAAFLQYPLKRVECPCLSGERHNVLFFIVESWRSDMVSEQITPNISGLARRSYVFTNHMSGGTVTHTGLFSLMYGLHPTYLRYIEMYPERYPPVLVSILKEKGYTINAFTSSNLERFSLKKMFFNGIAPSRYVMKYDQDNVANDRYVISKLIGSIKSEEIGSPFFAFVFLTSSHNGYGFPSDHGIFLPVCRESSFIFNKYADPAPLLNRYRNSLHYVDSLFGEVLFALRQARLDKKTIIVVTSDHGEEFNDRGNGYWGHGSNFTGHQSLVPLILYLPGNEQGRVVSRRSSHIDVAPTLLKHMYRCSNVISDYSNGSDLLDLPGHRSLIVKSYKSKAYIVDDTVYSEGIPLDSYSLHDLERKNADIDYREIRRLKEAETAFISRRAGR